MEKRNKFCLGLTFGLISLVHFKLIYFYLMNVKEVTASPASSGCDTSAKTRTEVWEVSQNCFTSFPPRRLNSLTTARWQDRSPLATPLKSPSERDNSQMQEATWSQPPSCSLTGF